MTRKDLAIVRREDLSPRCPHCERNLEEIHVRVRGIGFLVARNAVYFCPHCRKVLGVGPSRML